MDEVRIVRHRTHVWPVIIALVVLALVIAYVFFGRSGPAEQVGWILPQVIAPAVTGAPVT
jgi:integral membrane sensor domain MASE1